MNCSISRSALSHSLWLCAKELLELESEIHAAEDLGTDLAEQQDYHLSVWKMYNEMAETYVASFDPQSNMTKPSYFLDLYPVWLDKETLLWQEST